MSDQSASRPGEPHVRAATALDQPVISAVIRSARINPLSLHWQHFLIAEVDLQVVGVGQIKLHRDGSHELASIAVVPARQSRGIARLIIQALLASDPGPLYLTCRAALEPLYTRFGFRRVDQLAPMPPYFRLIFGLSRLASWLSRRQLQITVMFRPARDSVAEDKNSTRVL